MCVSLRCYVVLLFFFFKQKTAYEMRISDWSSDVCSSDLQASFPAAGRPHAGGTIYLTAADESGMMISFIQSNYMGFGSGVVVPDKIGRASCRERVCQYV